MRSTVPYALVVEDDPFILMDITTILEDAGFRVHEAENAEDAKSVLSEHFDSIVLLFSDVEMPGKTNGFALARHVATNWPHIEIVIASGRVTPVADDMPDKATFIRKPFNKYIIHDHLRVKLPDSKKPVPLKIAV